MPLTQIDSTLLESGGALENIGAGNITPAYLSSTAQYTGFKNRFINGNFYIWQRGTTISNPASGGFTYTADRWGTFVNGAGSTASITQQAMPAGTITSEPVEPAYFLRYAVTVAGSVTYRDFAQRIEDIMQMAGKTVTLSFYARASSTISVTPYWYNNFGTGGSADTNGNGTAFNIGTSWQKYSVTLTVGSASGRTIGPPNTSWCAIGLTLPNSTIQIDFALMQVELGSTATSFDYRPYGTELQLCQRYFEKSFEQGTAPANGASGTAFASNLGLFGVVSTNRTSFGGTQIVFKVPKRNTPIITKFGNSSGFWGYLAANGTALTWSASIDPQAVSENGFVISQQVVDGTFVMVNGHWTASAEL